MDDDRTTVMSRGDSSYPPSPASLLNETSYRSHRSDRYPMGRTTTTTVIVEERIHGPNDRPGVAQIEERTSFGETTPRGYGRLSPTPHSFGRAPRMLGVGRTTPARPMAVQVPRPTPRNTPAPTPIPVPVSRSTPPPVPSYAAPSAPRSSPPPLPPPMAYPVTRPADLSSEPPQPPVFVRDAVSSSPPAGRVTTTMIAQRRRSKVPVVLAIGLGTLGMLFTFAIVTGSAPSLRQPIMHGIAAERPVPAVVAAAAPAKVDPPVVPVVAPPAPALPTTVPATAANDMTWKETASRDPREAKGKSKDKAVAAKDPTAPHHHHARKVTVTSDDDDDDSSTADAPSPKTPPAAATAANAKKHAAPGDPDFDAAKEANDLARAQLEASFQ